MAVTLIAHTEVGSGGAANIEFTSIPGTYDDLWLIVSGRWNTAATFSTTTRIEINGSSASDYSQTWLRGTGTSVSSTRHSAQTSWRATNDPAATATASTFGNMSVYIPAYKNTSNFKQAVMEFASENNSSTDYWIGCTGALWRSTSAVTSLKILEASASSLVQYSTATLYGITKF